MFYFCFNFFELVLHLHQTIFAQLDQLPRLADLYERFLKIDLLLSSNQSEIFLMSSMYCFRFGWSFFRPYGSVRLSFSLFLP